MNTTPRALDLAIAKLSRERIFARNGITEVSRAAALSIGLKSAGQLNALINAEANAIRAEGVPAAIIEACRPEAAARIDESIARCETRVAHQIYNAKNAKAI